MALHLITGYAGQEHITSADQGAYNMGTFGEGEFVLDRGSKFAATVVTNNQITIADGEALMQGRFIKLPVGTTESVTIDNGTSDMKRKDLIVLRYSKDAGTGIESVALAVKKGTPSSSTPSDPAVTTGTITDGTDLVNEMKLYRVNIDGLNIVSVDTLFSVKTTMVEYMDEYQLPIATASVLGGIKKGVNVSIQNDGTLSVAEGGKYVKGVVQVGDGINVTEGLISVPDGSTSKKGILKVGSGLNVSDGVVSNGYVLPTASSSTKGGITIPANKSIYLSGTDIKFRTYNESANVLSYLSNKTLSVGGHDKTIDITDSALREKLANGWINGIDLGFSASQKIIWTITAAFNSNSFYRIVLKIINLETSSVTIPAVNVRYSYIVV